MIKAIVFVLVSTGILRFSWTWLRNPRSHGFWRFFAFESILILILLNADIWFHDPMSARQIVSWILLLISLILAIHGFYFLLKVGKPEGDFENTTVLISQGAYKFIRHPLYCSILLVGSGVFLKDPTLLAGFFFLLLLFFILATAKVEEKENLQKFGTVYSEYMKRTNLFIPYLF